MSKLGVHSFSISLDGYGAGPSQNPDNPLGVGTDLLHDWGNCHHMQVAMAAQQKSIDPLTVGQLSSRHFARCARQCNLVY